MSSQLLIEPTNSVQEKTMTQPKSKITSRKQRGAALLIAIFSLLLISAVAIALIMMAGTESAISANYKSSLQAFYDAKAGVEEGRGRLWGGNANPLSAATFPAFLPVGQVWFIINPASGETVAPNTTSNPYADTQYVTEWGSALGIATVKPYVNSATQLSGTPNPPYKWVRVTATTEKSLNIDVNNSGLPLDTTNVLCFDGSQILAGSTTACPSSTYQVFTVTSLAVTPSGGQRMEEYTVAQQSLNLNFPAALTLATNTVTFNGANSNPYLMDGDDGSGSPGTVPGCTTGSSSLPAIGVTDASGSTTNKTTVVTGIPRPAHYTGGGLSTPSITDSISLTNSLSSPATLNQLVTTVSQSADLVIHGNASNSDMPSTMSASNPETVVVDGNFSMTGNYTGYGLLIVTGNFSYTGNTGWKGIVLVVGDGTTTYAGSGGGNNEFDGTIFVATIKDPSGNLLTNFGNVGYDVSGGGGNGIFYNSCWVSKAQQVAGLKILSFKEIAN
jgi:hypothetical protein